MKALVSGGAKNGKSTFSENLIKEICKGENIYYLATMIPKDMEDCERIKRHREERKDKGFITIEWGQDLSSIDLDNKGTYLLDSVTALLSNEMFKDGKIYLDCKEKVLNDLIDISKRVKNIVFVSDYIYSDANKYDEYSEAYRRSLAYIDLGLAKICDKVYEVSFGIVKEHK